MFYLVEMKELGDRRGEDKHLCKRMKDLESQMNNLVVRFLQGRFTACYQKQSIHEVKLGSKKAWS